MALDMLELPQSTLTAFVSEWKPVNPLLVDGDALQFSKLFQLRDEVAQVTVFHGFTSR